MSLGYDATLFEDQIRKGQHLTVVYCGGCFLLLLCYKIILGILGSYYADNEGHWFQSQAHLCGAFLPFLLEGNNISLSIASSPSSLSTHYQSFSFLLYSLYGWMVSRWREREKDLSSANLSWHIEMLMWKTCVKKKRGGSKKDCFRKEMEKGRRNCLHSSC